MPPADVIADRSASPHRIRSDRHAEIVAPGMDGGERMKSYDHVGSRAHCRSYVHYRCRRRHRIGRDENYSDPALDEKSVTVLAPPTWSVTLPIDSGNCPRLEAQPPGCCEAPDTVRVRRPVFAMADGSMCPVTGTVSFLVRCPPRSSSDSLGGTCRWPGLASPGRPRDPIRPRPCADDRPGFRCRLSCRWPGRPYEGPGRAPMAIYR